MKIEYLFARHPEHGVGVDIGPAPSSYATGTRVIRFPAGTYRLRKSECKFQWKEMPDPPEALESILKYSATTRRVSGKKTVMLTHPPFPGTYQKART